MERNMRYRAGVEPAERMRALLRYANYTHVAQGLTETGYPPQFIDYLVEAEAASRKGD